MAKNKGRDRQREARWRRIIREHGRSGLGVREFCRRGRLTETAFYFWRRELQRRQEEHVSGVALCSAKRGDSLRRAELAKPEEHCEAIEPPPKPTFVAVRVNEHTTSPAGGRIEIELTSGQRLHVAAPVDRRALADVLLAVSDVERAVLSLDLEALDREGRPC